MSVTPINISIHALREEGDTSNHARRIQPHHFYPRPPRGGRQHENMERKRSDQNFYPRPPRGGRQKFRVKTRFSDEFLSTPSARRATKALTDVASGTGISIHALREEGDRDLETTITKSTRFLSTPSARRATAKTERKHPAFVSLYTSLHKLQRDVCKPNRKITPLLAQTAGFPVRSVPENHVCCRFALAGHQKISTLSWANSGCSPTCSTLVW